MEYLEFTDEEVVMYINALLDRIREQDKFISKAFEAYPNLDLDIEALNDRT